MKISLFFSVALLTLSLTTAQAQQRDYKGHILAANGQISDNGHVVGEITKAGIILDATGKKLAFLNADGTLTDGAGRKLGRRSKDGQSYYDASGNFVFKLKDKPGDTCDLVDSSGKVIGNVHDSMKDNACALHCFMAGMKAKTDHSHMKMKVQ